MPSKISDYDIQNYIHKIDLSKYDIFREYEKRNNVFICTNNFFINNHTDKNINNEIYTKICGNTNERYIEKKNEKYLIHYNISYHEKEIKKEIKETNLLIIKNLKLELSNKSIEIKKLINNSEISNNECEELIKDLYFNMSNLQKFNLENTNIIENKKYLFKIKKGEINIRNQIEQCDLINVI